MILFLLTFPHLDWKGPKGSLGVKYCYHYLMNYTCIALDLFFIITIFIYITMCSVKIIWNVIISGSCIFFLIFYVMTTNFNLMLSITWWKQELLVPELIYELVEKSDNKLYILKIIARTNNFASHKYLNFVLIYYNTQTLFCLWLWYLFIILGFTETLWKKVYKL